MIPRTRLSIVCALLLLLLAASLVEGEDGVGATPRHTPAASVANEDQPVDPSAADPEMAAAQRRRDLVMPLLWESPPDDTPEGSLSATMSRYAPGIERVLLASSPADSVENTSSSPEGGIDTTSSPAADGVIELSVPGVDVDAAEETLESRLSVTGLTLDESLAIALVHNLRIQIVRLSKDAVETDVAGAKAKFHPVIGATGTFAQADGDSGMISSEALTAFVTQEIPTGGNVTVSGLMSNTRALEQGYTARVAVDVVQPLFRGSGFYVARQDIKRAEYDLEVEQALLRAETLRVVAETKTAYFNVILAEDIIRVTSEALARDEALIEASEALFDAGLVTMRDVYSAKILLASDRAKLAEANGDLAMARNTFFIGLGLPVASPMRLVDKDIRLEPVELNTERWVETAIDSRPEVLQVEAEMEKSRLNIAVARNDIFPQIDFVGSLGRTSRESPLGVDLFSFDLESWSAGVVLGLPIGMAQARAATRRAKFEYRGLDRLLLETKRQIELEVRAAAIKLRSSEERVNAARVGVEQARGKLDIAKERFALGLATNRDVTDAQEELLGAETELLTATVDYNIGLAELEASVAGQI